MCVRLCPIAISSDGGITLHLQRCQQQGQRYVVAHTMFRRHAPHSCEGSTIVRWLAQVACQDVSCSLEVPKNNDDYDDETQIPKP
eukprot:3547032-Amphidinium_carterae.1